MQDNVINNTQAIILLLDIRVRLRTTNLFFSLLDLCK